VHRKVAWTLMYGAGPICVWFTSNSVGIPNIHATLDLSLFWAQYMSLTAGICSVSFTHLLN